MVFLMVLFIEILIKIQNNQFELQYTCAWKQHWESFCIPVLISSSQNCYDFLIISYVFSSTKWEKKAEQVLPGSEGVGEGGSRGQRKR
jgi:hypothetical protein